MSAKRPRLGVNHLTVVPTNFEPSEDAPSDAETDASLETDD